MFLKFRLIPYNREGDAVTDTREIMKMYLFNPSEFTMDVVVNLPFELLIFAFPPGTPLSTPRSYSYHLVLEATVFQINVGGCGLTSGWCVSYEYATFYDISNAPRRT